MTANVNEALGKAAVAATDAATAAAGVLPSVHPLVAGEPLAGNSAVASSFAGGAVCSVSGGGRIAILVGADLVDALSSSPVAGLDLAAAIQPALDAAATSLGHRAEVGRQLSPIEIVSELGEPFTVVTLAGAEEVIAALLVPTSLLADASETASSASPVITPSAISDVPRRGIELLHGVDMEVTVELGRTRMTVRDLLALAPGAVLELDRAAGSPADLLVNGRLIARGEVVVIDEDFGLRVTEIVDEKAAV